MKSNDKNKTYFFKAKSKGENNNFVLKRLYEEIQKPIIEPKVFECCLNLYSKFHQNRTVFPKVFAPFGIYIVWIHLQFENTSF